MASLTPRSGNAGGLLLNPVTGGQNSPTSGTVDSLAPSTVAVESTGLLNTAGTFDRQRGYLTTGRALVADNIAHGALAQILVVLRAMLLVELAQDPALGASLRNIDDLQYEDAIARATRAAANATQVDPNTIQ